MNNMSAHMKELVNTILDTRYTNLDKDFACCQELLQEAHQRNSAWGTAFAYVYLGDYYIATNNTIQSGQYLLLAKGICQQHSFQELYMQLCHFMGIYYSLLYDELNALQCYLDGLELSRLFHNLSLECLILNNIAHVFQCRDLYDEAKRYYFEALEVLNRVEDSQYERQKVLVLYNLADLFMVLEDIPMAERYLHECEAVAVEDESTRNYQNLLVCINHCTFAAISKNSKDAEFYAEKLLTRHLNTYDDWHTISGAMYSVCRMMIESGEQVFSRKLLDAWSRFCTPSEPFNLHRLMALNIHYHDMFSGEDAQNQAYREYFHALRQVTTIENNVRAAGMRGKIHLQEMLKQQESIMRENQVLESAAHLDELTGIYNRRHINKSFSKLENDSSINRVGIIMIDVDYFKEYNDSYGHARGDEVLVSIARALSKFADGNIWPGRYGGDEFICICIDHEDSEIENFIDSVYAEVASLSIVHEKSQCSPVVTLSSGYSSTAVADGVNTARLSAEADRALYVSKFQGRNQWSKANKTSLVGAN